MGSTQYVTAAGLQFCRRRSGGVDISAAKRDVDAALIMFSFSYSFTFRTVEKDEMFVSLWVAACQLSFHVTTPGEAKQREQLF